MAVCQVIYNILGSLAFYLIPSTRRLPMSISIMLGDTVSKVERIASIEMFPFSTDGLLLFSCYCSL